MGSDEMEGSEMTFLVVLFGAGGGADGRLAILGIPVDETTSPLVSLGSTTIGAALTAGIGFASLTDFAGLALAGAALAAGCGVCFAGVAGVGLFLVAALGAGVAFLAGAFKAVLTATFLAGTTGFFTGALAAGAVFLAAGLATGFLAMAFLAGAAFLGAALGAGLVAAGFFAGAAGFLMEFTAGLLAATFFDLVGLLLLTMLAPRVLKYQPAFAFDTCDSHGPGVGRGTWVTES